MLRFLRANVLSLTSYENKTEWMGAREEETDWEEKKTLEEVAISTLVVASNVFSLFIFLSLSLFPNV